VSKEMAAAYSENNKKNKNNLPAKCSYRRSGNVTYSHTVLWRVHLCVWFSSTNHFPDMKGKHSFDHISLLSEPTNKANPQISSELSTVYWETGGRRRPPAGGGGGRREEVFVVYLLMKHKFSTV